MRDAGKLHFLAGISLRERYGRIIFFVLILAVLLIASVCLVNALKWIDRPFAGFLLNHRMAVGYLGQEHWTGTQAGLKYPDKILKANNKDIFSMLDMEGLLTGSRIGDPINYIVERNGRRMEVAIPTMRFTLVDLVMTFGIYFFHGILYLLIGIIVFILKPDTKVTWVFLTACFLQSVASFITFDIESTHFGFIRVLFFCDTFLPSAVLHFSLLFPEKSELVDKRPYLIVIPYIFSAVLCLIFELFYPRPFVILINKLVIAYLIVSVLLFIASSLHAYFKHTSLLARERAKVVFLGALIALPIPAIAVLVASMGGVLWGTKVITNFSSIPIIIFPATIAYAIAKHNLFDVDVYVKRTVGYGIMTILVGATYFAVELIARAVLSPILGNYAGKVFPIFFALLVVFLFNPINRKVQEIVDKLFYRKKFDYKETVISVSNALTSVLDLTEVIKRIINTVRKEMFIDTAGIILTEPQKRNCRTLFIDERSDNAADDIKDVCVPHDDPLLTLVSREKKLITKYDIEENPSYQNVRESCGRRFEELRAGVMIPLSYQGEVKGAVAVGHKKSGHFYTREDIDLLSTLANHGAIAIENARMAEEMKKEEVVRTNLSRYLSPQIVDQIMQKNVQVNLGGDKKVVTVLFSDIRNFTKMTEKYNPEQLVSILNEYFTEMARIIFENQGSLDKYIGDAIVAVFGSLVPLENSAVSAIKAAIQMMRHMPLLNDKWKKRHGFTMDIGIGINTGEVFLGNIGSPERMEFTVIGDTVNVASRFSGLAKPGQILITRETLVSLDSDVPYSELPPAEVKGKTGKMDIFEIVYGSH